MDLDLDRHKEFRFSLEGSFVAVGAWQLGSNAKPEVCVIRVSDGKRFDLPNVSYDFGGRRLELNAESRVLFSGAYDKTGIAAYEFESGSVHWHRRDLKQLGELAYDAFAGVLYCLCEHRTILLTAANGREYAYYHELNDVFFGKDSSLAVFDSENVTLQNRVTNAVHVLERQRDAILAVAFTRSAAVVSWVSGPVTAYDCKCGELLWTYKPAGTHAYAIAPASDDACVWVADQPYRKPPWQRLRLLSPVGEIRQEVRCTLGHSFAIAPYSDSVIRGDLAITPIAALASE